MKKLSIYFAVLLLVLSFALLCVSCSSTGTAVDSSGEDSTAADSTPEEGSLTIFENNAYNCVIVYPEASSGISPAVISDKEYEGKDTSDDNMILVGKTSVKGTESAFEDAKFGTVYTQLIGNKYQVVVSDSEGGIAFTEKIKNILGNSPVPSITIDESWIFSETKDELLAVLKAYDGGSIDKTVDCGDGTFMKVIRGTSAEEYNAYIEKSKSAGYSVYSENAIGDNIFTTMTIDGYNATFVYLANLNESRLIIEPSGTFSLPELGEENVYTEICSSSVTQVGIENGEEFQNGMCYIFKLADGRFVIIDGGFNQEFVAEKIMTTLHDLAEDPNNITVAAWFITHFHTDHWGVVRRISKMEDDGMVIERIIYNLPDDEYLNAVAEADDGEVTDGIAKRRNNVNTAMDLFKEDGTIIYKAHPGQVYHLANADFTIYSTAEMYAPIENVNLNNSCLVIRVEIEGQSLLFPADSAYMQSENSIAVYGEHLKSDFLQVIHHGYDGGNTDYYELVDPQVVFWPIGLIHYEGERLIKDAVNNEYFFREEGTSVKEIIVAGSSVVTIPLPYDTVTSAE